MVGKLIISRESAFVLRLRKLRVIIDEQMVGELGNGQTIDLEVPTGQHRLRVAVDLQTSDTLTFNMEADRPCRFHCTARVPGSSILDKILIALNFRRRSQTLTLVQVLGEMP